MQTVFVWINEDDHIQIDAYDAKPGDPCLMIKYDKDTVWQWIRAMIQALEDGQVDDVLPGKFGTIPGETE